MSTQTLHFTVGEDAGILLMNIAQEHLLYNYDVEKAIKTIEEGLVGCPRKLTLNLLSGDHVILVDVEKQEFLVGERDNEIHKIFPKIDILDWCDNKAKKIANEGRKLNNLIKTEVQKKSSVYFNLNLTYNDVYQIYKGNNDELIDRINDDEKLVQVSNLIRIVEKYIEQTPKILQLIRWFEETYPEKFKNLGISIEESTDCQVVFTKVMENFKSLINGEMIDDDTENELLDNYLKSQQEINETIYKGIEPVNILDNYSAGWLAPDGDFYGLNGEIANMLHTQISDALLEKGIIPSDEKYLNPDAWLEENGWIRIHGNNVQFAGCLNYKLDKKNVDITNEQLDEIYRYIRDCHTNIIRVGWRQERSSIGMFMSLAKRDLNGLYKKYFEY